MYVARAEARAQRPSRKTSATARIDLSSDVNGAARLASAVLNATPT
jgi:hypothetical protein